MISRFIWLCLGYFLLVLQPLQGKNRSCFCEQWLRHAFYQPEESGDYAPPFRGSARLGRCFSSSKEGLHWTYGFVQVLCKECLRDVTAHSDDCSRWVTFCAKRSQTLRDPNVNSSLATVNERSIDEGSGWLTSTKHLLHDNLKEAGFHVYVTKEQRFSKSWLNGLQHCPARMAYKTARFGGSVLWINFCSQESIVNHSVHPMTLKPSLLKGARIYRECSCRRAGFTFCVSRPADICFLQGSREACIGKDSFNKSCNIFCIHCVCWGWPFVTRGRKMIKELFMRYHTYFIPSHVSFIDYISFAYGASFYIQPNAT